MDYRIIPAAFEHIAPIAAAMREADRRELAASHGHSPEQALKESLAWSPLAWTCLVSACLFPSYCVRWRFSKGSWTQEFTGDVQPPALRALPAAACNSASSGIVTLPLKSLPSLSDGKIHAETEWVPAFMWGVGATGSALGRTGAPWLLATEAIRFVERQFSSQSRSYVQRMQDLFPRLENYVHKDNIRSRRWLAWCGFHIEPEPQAYGVNGELFYHFWKGEKAHV